MPNQSILKYIAVAVVSASSIAAAQTVYSTNSGAYMPANPLPDFSQPQDNQSGSNFLGLNKLVMPGQTPTHNQALQQQTNTLPGQYGNPQQLPVSQGQLLPPLQNQNIAPLLPQQTKVNPAGAIKFDTQPINLNNNVNNNTASFNFGNNDETNPLKPTSTRDKSQEVDTSALRFYAAQRDLQRVGIEMRRLQAAHPGWAPPPDLFSPQQKIDEQPLWDLFATGSYDRVRAEITEIKSLHPEWLPSEDLTQKLKIAEARTSLERAFGFGDWASVLSIASREPNLLVCEELQSLWYLGETLARVQDYQRSFDLYKYILSTCDNPEERFATVQKASLVLPSNGFQALVQLGKTLPNGLSEFEDISYDIMRRQLGEITQNGRDLFNQVDQTQLQKYANFAVKSGNPDDLGLLGWYYYSQEEYEAAKAWFLTGARINRDPKLVEGLILSLRGMDDHISAFDIAKTQRKTSDEINDQYIQIVSSSLTDEDIELKLSEKSMTQFEDIVMDAESALGAQSIGWQLLDEGELEGAREWFSQSIKWDVNEEAVIGLAVRAARAKHRRTLRSIIRKYGDEYASLKKFK